jgi:phosphatidylinositol alpha-mannosyltransferase
MGGSNRSIATLIVGMRPYATCILASPGEGPFRKYCISNDVADGYVTLPEGSRFRRILASLRLTAWVIRHRNRLTTIHAQALTGLNIVALAAVLTRLPVVVRVSDPDSSRWGRLLGPIWRRLLRRLVVVPVSETALDVAVLNGLCDPWEAHVVPNPVDPDDVVAIERRRRGDLVVGFLGNPSPRKGFDLLSTVVSSVQSPVSWRLFTNPRANEVPADMIDSLIRQHPVVQFVGRERDVRQAYAQVDIVFVPSRSESFSRVVAEAMLNGIPVVASDILPHRRLLGENEAGILFPSGDGAAAAAAIDALASSQELRAGLGKMGRLRGTAYRPEEIVRLMLPLYGISTTLGLQDARPVA